MLFRGLQASDNDNTPTHEAASLQVKMEAVTTFPELQRPETSRGRLIPTLSPQCKDPQPAIKPQNAFVAAEKNHRVQKYSKMDEKERASLGREESSLRERNERERKVVREVEEEREHLLEKEKQMHLLQEELKREEESEEWRLKEQR